MNHNHVKVNFRAKKSQFLVSRPQFNFFLRVSRKLSFPILTKFMVNSARRTANEIDESMVTDRESREAKKY